MISCPYIYQFHGNVKNKGVQLIEKQYQKVVLVVFACTNENCKIYTSILLSLYHKKHIFLFFYLQEVVSYFFAFFLPYTYFPPQEQHHCLVAGASDPSGSFF